MVNRTFHHFPLFLQGYTKLGMIKEVSYLILSVEVNMDKQHLHI